MRHFQKQGKTIEFWSRNFPRDVFEGAESNDVKIIKIGSDFEKLCKFKDMSTAIIRIGIPLCCVHTSVARKLSLKRHLRFSRE